MESLPSEIINEILLKVDKPTLYYASQVCRQWRTLSLRQVKIITTVKDFDDAFMEGDRLSVVKSKYDRKWIYSGLCRVCEGGHKELAEFLIAKRADNWNVGLYSACERGHKELAELTIGTIVFVVLVKEVIKNL